MDNTAVHNATLKTESGSLYKDSLVLACCNIQGHDRTPCRPNQAGWLSLSKLFIKTLTSTQIRRKAKRQVMHLFFPDIISSYLCHSAKSNPTFMRLVNTLIQSEFG